MKTKDISKIKVTAKSIILIDKKGKRKSMKRSIPLMQFIHAAIYQGLLKSEQLEFDDD